MAAPQINPLPPFFEMADGYQIIVTALDATTGATVSGVVVSNVSIDVDPGGAAVPDVKVPQLDPAYFEGDT
jgi:hypothetical protein